MSQASNASEEDLIEAVPRGHAARRAPAPLLAFALLGLSTLGSLGCASTGTLEAAGELDGKQRRPDGVAIDPMSLPPRARDQADATEGFVTLRAPLGVDRAILAVTELFRKVVLEDGEGLESLFTRDALAVTTTAPNAGPAQTPQAVLFWQQRFRRLDYTKLAGETIFRQAELEIYRAEDALEVSPHPTIRVEALNDNDVVIRAPILTAHLGTDRLFGDEIIFWLRREGDRYRIYRILEDFQIN